MSLMSLMSPTSPASPRLLMLRRVVFILPLLFAAWARAETPPPPARTWVRILGTTDRHGALDRAALLGGYLAIERREHPGVLLVDGGDLFTGTLESDLGEGAPIITAMNALGYTATALGNHDFDFGPVGLQPVPKQPSDDPRGALKARVAEARFPILSANIVGDDGKPFAGTRPYTIVTTDGVRVAIVGGTTESTPRTTMALNLVGLRVLPLAPALAQAARAARAEGAMLVVAVVHAGGECAPVREPVTADKPGDTSRCKPDAELFQLARDLAALDRAGKGGKISAIFGGHTHATVTGVVDGIPLSQADAKGAAFSAVSLEVDLAHKRPTGAFRIDPPTPVIPGSYHGSPVVPDAKVAAAIAPDLARAATRRAEPVGVHVDSKVWRAYGTESPLGNLVADLMRAATGADLGLVNGGGLRADLPAGDLSYGALFEVLPFSNRLATVKTNGAALKRLFAANLAGAHGLLSIGGGTLSATCQGAVPTVTITLSSSGRTIADSDTIRIGVSDFLALGGDDFAGIIPASSATISDDAPTMRDAVAAALRARRTLSPATLLDPTHPRIQSPRPLKCAPGGPGGTGSTPPTH
jgi:5'-nucleotidase